MTPDNEFQSYFTELRRGSLTLATLVCLRKPHYGYVLLKTMHEAGIEIEANTLYPLLRRLEEQKLLTSSWDMKENRPRKYYTISDRGEQVLSALLDESETMHRCIVSLIANNPQ